MPQTTEEILTSQGWEVECHSPFEIRHSDGSFATGQAANAVLDAIRLEASCEKMHLALNAIAGAAVLAKNAATEPFHQRLWVQVEQTATAAQTT